MFFENFGQSLELLFPPFKNGQKDIGPHPSGQIHDEQHICYPALTGNLSFGLHTTKLIFPLPFTKLAFNSVTGGKFFSNESQVPLAFDGSHEFHKYDQQERSQDKNQNDPDRFQLDQSSPDSH